MIILVILLVLLLLYFYGIKNHDYWLKRNVKHDPPIPIFGNHLRNQFGMKSLTELADEMYCKFPGEKVVGYYKGRTPELIIRDPEIVRQILSVNFSHFYERGLGRDPAVERVFMNLFHVEGDKWKLLRQRLTSAFTSGKLKNMFPLIITCANKLQSVGEQIVSKGGDFDARELMARFTTEFIGVCGFGIEMDSINNENSMFRDLGRALFTRPWRSFILLPIWELFPEVRGVLRVYNSDIIDRITNLCELIRKQRNYKPIGRNDFIDLLLELESKGKIEGESIEHTGPDGKPLKVDMEMDLVCMSAQVFVFFAAGFETSSSATSFTLHQLAFHPEVQQKIQIEIDEVLSRYDNKLCYEAIAEMNLLDMAFKEGMRLFPSLGALNRVCTRRFTIPGLDITIDPGVKIVIPIQAMQNDEQYFENASEFIPERFATTKHLPKYVYMPFGEGPRACIGTRLGQMQSLAGLAAILQKFQVEPAANTRRKLSVDHTSNVVQSIKGGIPLRLKLRNT